MTESVANLPSGTWDPRLEILTSSKRKVCLRILDRRRLSAFFEIPDFTSNS